MKIAFVFASALYVTQAHAQSVDCDALIHSKVPYQISLKSQDGKVSSLQIYRSDALYRVQYAITVAGKVQKYTFQSNFMMSIRRPGGTVAKVDWSIPTSKFFWESGIKDAEFSISDDVSNKYRNTYNLIGDEIFNVGPCIISTKHYTIDHHQTTGLLKSEIWFSPDLQAPLKSRLQLKFGSNPTKDTSSEAVDISTHFTPAE